MQFSKKSQSKQLPKWRKFAQTENAKKGFVLHFKKFRYFCCAPKLSEKIESYVCDVFRLCHWVSGFWSWNEPRVGRAPGTLPDMNYFGSNSLKVLF
jgi:hypothetical protein